MLITVAFQWRVYRCSLYYSSNHFVYMNIFTLQHFRGKRIVIFTYCVLRPKPNQLQIKHCFTQPQDVSFFSSSMLQRINFPPLTQRNPGSPSGQDHREQLIDTHHLNQRKASGSPEGKQVCMAICALGKMKGWEQGSGSQGPSQQTESTQSGYVLWRQHMT